MFALKNYQERAIEALRIFLQQSREHDPAKAFHYSLVQQGMDEEFVAKIPYRDSGFDGIPYVCIRIPTGGGKTVLASYSIITAAREYLDVEYPITLWLVPSTTIRKQTVEALKTPGHPYREKLDQIYNQQVLVLDVDEVSQIRPQDIGSKAIVVVSTLANLRVSDTSGRKIYAYHENFEPHFAKVANDHPKRQLLEKVSENDIQDNGLSKKEIGKIKYSFANLLALHNPLVIVDEAHNARTNLTFETFQRLYPAAIIEFTATPDQSVTTGSNVLFSVSASELKAEEMIKLPIMLAEESKGWKQSVSDAVINRNRLAIEAQKDPDYIRPIVLFQAEAKNGKVTVEVLKNYLIDDLKIEPEKIAVVTGSQRELDNIDLFAQDCLIEHIITIEALKEGWDCPFAYVFCSVKQVSSSKDAEQLLGRVLRMPYARRRVIEDLNRAYAHLATSKFARAASELTDKLISMGFEEMDVATYVRQYDEDQIALFGSEQQGDKPKIRTDFVTDLPVMPDLSGLADEERKKLVIASEGESVVVRVKGEISANIHKVLKAAVAGTNKKTRDRLNKDIKIHNIRIEEMRSPAEKGEVFGCLPMLCANIQGELELVEPETLLDAGQWILLDYPAKLPGFHMEETSRMWEIDVDGSRVTYGVADEQASYDLNDSFVDVSDNDLIRWLDRELRQKDVMQRELIQFISGVVRDLLNQPNMTLTGLVRNKFPLVRVIRDLIIRYRKQAQQKGYQQVLFDDASATVSDEFTYEFSPEYYPAKAPFYHGKYKFQKHYYGGNRIEDLKATGEEFECAQIIDSMPETKYWIRNLVNRDTGSFWLPLAHGKFYPDFIIKLLDGRILVVEYKGSHLADGADTAAKNAVGELWAHSGGEDYLFITCVDKKTDSSGRTVFEQIKDTIN
jgi:type III restriction enzyme